MKHLLEEKHINILQASCDHLFSATTFGTNTAEVWFSLGRAQHALWEYTWDDVADEDGDGIVSDEELSHVADIKKLEHDLRKQRAQRRMATASLVAMAAFTAAMFFVDLERVKALADISNLFYLTGGGIVSVYMGASAIMNRTGK